MNKLYIKNLRYLKRICPEFYNKVINVNELSAYITKIKRGKKNIIKDINGKKLSVHSNYDPIQQAKVIRDYAFQQENDIILIFGMGLAYELKEMMKRDPKKRYVIIEPDIEIFKVMLQNTDFESFFNEQYKLTLILEDNSQLINAHFYSTINEEKTTSVRFVVLPYYQYVYESLISETLQLIKETIRVVEMNFVIDVTTDRQWILNFARNTQYLYETLPVEALEGFKGIPAIIVGAGPSLEYNLQHLKKLEDQALIVAAGNGTLLLEKNDMKAHIVGAMDGNLISENIYNDLKINNEATLFYSSQVFSTIPAFMKGRKFLMNQVLMDLYINMNLEWPSRTAYSGGSITNVLAYNLSKLGCDPIIFLGQDLCARDGRLYSKGAVNDHVALNEQSGIKAKNIRGEDVYTNKGYLLMKYSMEKVIQTYPNVNYLNGTKYGLHIDGSIDIDFNEYVDNVLLKAEKHKFKSIIEECFKESCEEKIDQFIVNLINDINEIKEICKEIVIFIDSDASEKVKERYVIKKEKELEKNKFYKQVLSMKFANTLDLMFKQKGDLDKKKHRYLYYCDKCNLMSEGIRDVYGLS